jgi:hypothetical protein
VIYEVNDRKRMATVIALGPRDSARVYAIADAEMKRRRLRRIS